jgi:hypothetical protein
LVGVNRRRVVLVGHGKTGQDKKTRQDKSRIKILDRKTKKGNGGKNKKINQCGVGYAEAEGWSGNVQRNNG